MTAGARSAKGFVTFIDQEAPMGMDVYGIKPSGERGRYFRNTVWYLSPLWEYVCKVCPDILTTRDMIRGEYNANHKISAKKATAIGKRLEKMIRTGKAQIYAGRYRGGMRISSRDSAALVSVKKILKAVGGKPEKPQFTVKNLRGP